MLKSTGQKMKPLRYSYDQLILPTARFFLSFPKASIVDCDLF